MREWIAAFVFLVLVGCATTKTLQATGGSRSDGVVRLSFEYGAFESPQIDEAQAHSVARDRCKVWGYSDAEAFGGVTKVCNQTGMYGCTGWMVTKEYQCTGANTPT
ncbi:YecR family lipoprotein [Sphingomonas sp. LY54]|uniref:YecR family lipoprotein n=1 Tax=Sphingomonas sp. LY54 TaxID=3095343 RepID=UPI002D799ECF|nr:YecR family lipoprotein [Sphingomonas sp. LY54]WRP27227.1 YecR family lipoprotein [Sphingomonas sp. LY54]